jgi:Mycothiol maleylpyruvate isomerase N-terminal domain
MTDTRSDHLQKEAAAWASFLDAVGKVDRDRFDEPGVVPGWSVKDLVWHNAGWADFTGDELQKAVGKPFEDPFARHEDEHWDRMSAEIIAAARPKSFDEVLTDAEAVRERVRAVWQNLPEIDDERALFFAEETFIHYAEHAAEVLRFAKL